MTSLCLTSDIIPWFDIPSCIFQFRKPRTQSSFTSNTEQGTVLSWGEQQNWLFESRPFPDWQPIMFNTTYEGDKKKSVYPIFDNNNVERNPSAPPMTPPPTYPGAVPTVKFYPQATNTVSPVMGVPPTPVTLPIDGPQTTVIVTQRSFGPIPIMTKCSFCGNQITTSTDSTSGLLTYTACCVIAVIGCFYGCCLIPFCCDPCKDVEHRCPQCNHQLGTYERLNCSR